MIGAPIREGVRRLFRMALHLRRLGRADARAELESVLEARTEQLISLGMSGDAARAEAIDRLAAVSSKRFTTSNDPPSGGRTE